MLVNTLFWHLPSQTVTLDSLIKECKKTVKKKKCNLIIIAELTAVGSLPPVAKVNPETGAGFGVALQRSTQTLQQVVTTVTGPMDAGLQTPNGLTVTEFCR